MKNRGREPRREGAGGGGDGMEKKKRIPVEISESIFDPPTRGKEGRGRGRGKTGNGRKLNWTGL